MAKADKVLVNFNIKNAVYQVGDGSVEPFVYATTFSKNRTVNKKEIYGDGELQSVLYSEQQVTGSVGVTARDEDFELAVGFMESVAGGKVESAVKEGKVVNFGFETEYLVKGQAPKVKKVWVLNCTFEPASESLNQNTESINESTYEYAFTSLGVNLKNAQGTADYVDSNGQTHRIFIMSAIPTDTGYSTFLQSVPTPKKSS